MIAMALRARLRCAMGGAAPSATELALALSLVALDVVARLAPHAPNFTPLAASANLAVWASSGMYAADLDGLVHCYVAALPFLRNTVLGDMFWTALLFGGWWSARALFSRIDIHSRQASLQARP